jgi:hypothetical protein
MSKRLRRKWTLRAHGQQVVFIKKAAENPEHVIMKAFIWALYLPEYPELKVEIRIGDRYKPDVVQLDAWGDPLFWGEAGSVGKAKIESLTRRYRETHFAMAKWDADLTPYADLVREAVEGRKRRAPFDLIAFPPDSAERFIDEKGHITITFEDVERLTIPGQPGPAY